MMVVARVILVLRRALLRAIPTMACVVGLGFIILQAVPGDAADVMAGESGAATSASIAALRSRFGLDLPILDRFLAYLNDLAHFSLGMSPRFNVPVASLIASRLPGTLILMAVSLILAVSVGLAIGSVMATQAGRWPDRVLLLVTLLFYSVPGFWMGLMLIVLFSVHLGWLPSGGSGPIGVPVQGLAGLLATARYMVLPVVSLALFYIALYARLTRAAVLEVLGQDFVRTAAAKGLLPLPILLRHVLRNALIPITTVVGLHVGGLLGGAVVVETVYSWPGLGRLAFEAITGRDTNVLLGILLLSSFVVIAANILVDLLQAWLDPRIGATR